MQDDILLEMQNCIQSMQGVDPTSAEYERMAKALKELTDTYYVSENNELEVRRTENEERKIEIQEENQELEGRKIAIQETNQKLEERKIEIQEENQELEKAKQDLAERKLKEEKKSRIWNFLGKIGTAILILLLGVFSEHKKEEGVSLKSNDIFGAAKDAIKRL